MNSIDAFLMGEANRGKNLMVFDWDKAARLIRDMKPKKASAGLRDDWENTGGEIFSHGRPITGRTFLASTWEVPEIDLDGDVIPCYRMQYEVPRWGAETKWPKSALDILNGESQT